MAMTLEELAGRIGAELHGDPAHRISGCAGLAEAGSGDVSFLANRKYVKLLGDSQAGAVVLEPTDVKLAGSGNLLVCDDPYFAFRQAVVALHGLRSHPPAGISSQAVIDPSATLGSDCCIQPLVYVAAEAAIGNRCVVYPHCYVGPKAVIGDDCVLFANVTIYDGCRLGDRVTIHAGTVIGQDGFGYATHQGAHHKIPHIGSVIIEDDVEIGANCAIDRATIGSTRIGKGSKFSDLVAIGHGTRIGPHNLLVAQVGVAGSTETGSHVAMGGQVGVAGHLKIGAQARIAAKAGVMTDVPGKAQVGGQPALPITQTKRSVLALTRLPGLVKQFKKLRNQVAQLEAKLDKTAKGGD